MTTHVLTVYAATADVEKDEILYLCTWDGFVINGHYELKKNKEGAFLLPLGSTAMLRGYISANEPIAFVEVLKRFRAGERCSKNTCEECGHDPDSTAVTPVFYKRVATLLENAREVYQTVPSNPSDLRGMAAKLDAMHQDLLIKLEMTLAAERERVR